jgi:hypothetical protein
MGLNSEQMRLVDLKDMKRQRFLKCENCFYWKRHTTEARKDDNVGSCKRFPHIEEKYGEEWCGEFEVK